MAEPSPAARVLAAVAADGHDRTTTPTLICRACVKTLPVDGAALSLIVEGAHREIAGASDDTVRRIEEIEVTLGEGPGLAAFAARGPVLVADLDGAGSRWPVYVEAVAATGIRAVFVLPIQIGAVRLGVLTLYRHAPGPLPGHALADALQIADVVALLMVGPGDALAHDFDEHWLDRSAWGREVDQATGMLIVQLGVGAEEAFVRLRGYAFAHNRSLADVAADIVARRLRLGTAEL